MKQSLRLLLVACALLTTARIALGVEPVEPFLAALKAKQYYDEALVYLDQLKASPRTSKEVIERIPYEQGMILLDSASQSRDVQVRERQLTQAEHAFYAFIQQDANHSLIGSARNQLATILIERGRNMLLQGGVPDQLVLLKKAAGDFYAQAGQQFAAAETTISDQLEKMPKLIPPDQTELQAEKLRLSGDLAQARLMRATVEYESAKLNEPGSEPFRQGLAAAAKGFSAVYDAYRTRAVGILARFWEGRCLEELGQYEQALGCYAELMDLPDSPETRVVRNGATRHALQCWTHETVKKSNAAIERGDRWLKESAPQASEPDVMAIQYLTGIAYHEQAKTLAEKDPQRKRLTTVARDHIQPVASTPGEFQRDAKTMLLALSGGKPRTEKPQAFAQPKNFVEGFEQAQLALGQMQEIVRGMEAAQSKGDVAAAKAFIPQRDEAARQLIELLRAVINLRDKDTQIESLNSARYYLCYLHWTLGNYYDAAVLGEFLAQNYPETLPGRQGVKIALAAWVKLYHESQSADKKFEIAQIQRVAELTFAKWADQPEAEEAALTLVNFAATSGQAAKAPEYLARISADSPRRGPAELRAGQALWSSYLKSLRVPVDQRPVEEQMTEIRNQARDILMQGVKRMQDAGRDDSSLATAAFSLAQIYFEAGEPAKALEWLTQPKFGPLTIVSADAASANANFAIETYKMALRLYVAVNPPQLDKAEQAMTSLDALVQGSGNSQAADNLTAIYIGLSRQLQEDLKALRATGKAEEIKRTSEAFQIFLGKLLERNAGGSLASKNWVAETYYNLAKEMGNNQAAPTAQVMAAYEKAAAAYQQLLGDVEKDPKYQDSPDALVSFRLRLADCYRGAGNYDEAIKLVAEVLRQKPTLLTAQVQGAEIYQARGETDPVGYEKAIMGGSPDTTGKNRIWGWSQLSRVTMGNPKFASFFHLARINIVESRYHYALKEKDPARRKRLLQAAVQDVRTTYNVRPDLGGAQTTAQYDRALKQVQKALGLPETGLQEFKQQAVETTAASK